MSSTGLSYCQVMVERTMAGFVGLEEILAALAEEGREADTPGLVDQLMQQIKAHNYVPRSAISQYREALLREYRQYLKARNSGGQGRLWRDPRKEQQPWYPTIFAEKCDGCGECLPSAATTSWAGSRGTAKCLCGSPTSALPAVSSVRGLVLERRSFCRPQVCYTSG